MEVKASRMPPERPAMNGLVCSGCESQLTAGPPNGLALANFGFRLAADIQVRLVGDRCRTDQSLSASRLEGPQYLNRLVVDVDVCRRRGRASDWSRWP
jgi:hypothetical protein